MHFTSSLRSRDPSDRKCVSNGSMLIISTYMYVEYFDSNNDIKESHGAFSILSELLYHLIGNDC